MEQVVAFYQLSAKFVDSQDTPAEAKNLIYYSLAIGHHVGVLDCFTSVLEMSLEKYKRWVVRLPPGEGRQKLAGATRWGEIEIRQEHVGPVLEALRTALPDLSTEEVEWSTRLSQLLHNIVSEPVLYLLVRVL
jgi:formate hydrogenlyase maturation protein HycH